MSIVQYSREIAFYRDDPGIGLSNQSSVVLALAADVERLEKLATDLDLRLGLIGKGRCPHCDKLLGGDE